MNMIFLGAGASATFGIPTTPEFTNNTNELLHSKNQSLLVQIIEDHKIQRNCDPNYEDILGYLTAFIDPFELRNNDYRLNFATRHREFKQIDRLKSLIEEIYAIVCTRCNQPFVRNEKGYLKPEDLSQDFNRPMMRL
jgi:hypothetical protein